MTNKMKVIFFFLLISFYSFSQFKKDVNKKIISDIENRKPWGQEFENQINDEIDNPYYNKEELLNKIIEERKHFQELSKPNPQSNLSIFLRRNLNLEILKKIKPRLVTTKFKLKDYSKKYRDSIVTATFRIKKRNSFDRINLLDKDLKKEIKEVLDKYPIEKLGLDKTNRKGKITVQLFTFKNKKAVINASSTPVINEPPQFSTCHDINSYSNLTSCNYKVLYNFILSNLSTENISKQKLRGEIYIRPRFSIDKNGNIYNIDSVASNKIIKQEIDRVISLYKEKIIPATINNKPVDFLYETTYALYLEKIK